MRVLQVVTQLERAGAQTLSHWLETTLSSDFEIDTLFLYNKSGSDLFADERALMGSRPSSILEWLRLAVVLIKRLRRERNELLVCHTHFAIAACVLASPLVRFPSIVAVHHWPIENYPLVCRLLHRVGEKANLIRVQVCVSDSISRRNADIVISNPIPDGLPTRDDSMAEVDLLIVARHSHEKSIDTAIRALETLDDRRLTLVGVGPLTDELRELARTLGVQDRVTFLGTAPNPEVRRLIASCNLLVLPSKWEAMPMVLLEGLAEDAQILVSDIAAHNFLLDAGAAHGFEVGDVSSLVAAVLAVGADEGFGSGVAEARAVLRMAMSESATADRWRKVLGAAAETSVKQQVTAS
jgi:glycosyltransferase involved in cell wall biosynthesis